MANCTDEILRMRDLCGLLALSRSTVYEKINPKSRRYDAKFPKPFKLSVAAIGWRKSDILIWIDQLPLALVIPEKADALPKIAGTLNK